MTRQQLICALEVGRAGSINRAAQSLFMAQPNLSSTIRELEAEIGITLFKRSSRGVEVTHAGEQFLRQAADIVAQFDALESAYHSRDDSVSLSVTTARSSAISDRIARYLNDFAESGVPRRSAEGGEKRPCPGQSRICGPGRAAGCGQTAFASRFAYRGQKQGSYASSISKNSFFGPANCSDIQSNPMDFASSQSMRPYISSTLSSAKS